MEEKNIIKLKDYYINKVKEEYINIIIDLEEYNIKSLINDEDLDEILLAFYNYYKKNGIIYSFVDSMINHLKDIYYDSIRNNESLDVNYLLSELEFYELLYPNIKLKPKEEKKFIKELKYKIGGGNYAE